MVTHTAALADAAAPRPGAVGVELWWRRLAEATDAAGYAQAWLALQCAAIDRVGTALLLLADASGAFVPAAVWPDARADVAWLGPVAQRCLGERRALSERPETDGRQRLLAAYPLEEGSQLLGCIVLDLQPRPDAELAAMWRALHWGSGRIEALLLRRALEQQGGAQQRARLALEVAVSVGEQPTLEQALMQFANEIAAQLGCERVGVGLLQGERLRLHALSNTAWFERTAAFAVALENAMEEACDQLRSVAHPPLPATAGAVAVAHRDLAGQGVAATVVLAVRGRVIGALTALRAQPADGDWLAALEAVAALLAPQVALRADLHRWVAGRGAEGVRAFWRACRDPRRPSFRVGLALLAALLAVLGFARGDYRVAGKAVIEGEVQRALVAPFEGFIAAAGVRAGQTVAAGTVLAALDDRDLVLERRKWAAQREQADRKYRDALAKHDRANARILAAQLAEAAAQVALADDKIRRARIAAPFAGVVVSGDLSQMLGTPVEKGKVLFEVAPLDAYRVILKVPEQAIREVRPGQRGEIVLAGLSGDRLAFTVRTIGVAAAEDGNNVFRVEAELGEAVTGLRPGMEGVGKIVIGERRLAWIWTHTFVEWLALKLWYWLP